MKKINLKLVADSERMCNECTACCTAKTIMSGNVSSVQGQTCKHVNSGCSIYNERPPACVEYKCLWLEGYMSEDARPDIVGYVLDLDVEVLTNKVFITAQEYRPGSFDDEKILYQLKKLVRELKEPVFLSSPWRNPVTIIVPDDKKWYWHNQIKTVFGTNVHYLFC